MSEIIDELARRNIRSFEQYIKQIRFPFFKKLKLHTEIKFDYPFTVLVGPNGSGKSSTLQALYGCPNGKNVSDFWFSTSLDPIEEGGDERNRFIYKYKPKGYSSDVEVIKQRTKRNATQNRLEDPDYWETARPSIKDGMAKMPEFLSGQESYRNETRWKAVEKNVVYIDFRAELSAFDKFFYFGTFEKRQSIRSKQDFIRHRSKALSTHIDYCSSYPQLWHSRTTSSVIKLTDDELLWVNRILGKSYIAAKIINHDLYNNDGYSIVFTNSDKRYTEAVAGSGEVSVVNCVVKVLKASRNSLILLDEPEVSLHPGAQIELRNLLLSSIRQYGHQVVLSTHSEHFVHGLPNNAVKLFQYSAIESRYEVLNECSPQQAFLRLGVNSFHKKKIYVEDKLAQVLVEEAIKEIDSELLQSFHVIPYPGGAATIVDNLLVQFLIDLDTNNDIVILDGDMISSVYQESSHLYSERLEAGDVFIKRRSSDIPLNLHCEIDSILSEQIKGISGNIKLPLNGGNSNNERQKIDFKLKILDLYHDKFYCMNVDTPEELIWEVADGDRPTNINAIKDDISSGKFKERFEMATISNVGEENTNSITIYNLQIAFLQKRNVDHPLWVEFKSMLVNILDVERVNI